MALESQQLHGDDRRWFVELRKSLLKCHCWSLVVVVVVAFVGIVMFLLLFSLLMLMLMMKVMNYDDNHVFVLCCV